MPDIANHRLRLSDWAGCGMAGPGFVKKTPWNPPLPTSNVSALESPSLENDTGTIQASKTLVSAASGPVPMACRTSGSNSTQLSSRLL